MAIVMERESAGLRIRVERTRWLWEDGGRVVAQRTPLEAPREPPGTAGWRRPGPGNLAFGGMNGERWERLPTAPCDPIGRRARACVRVCLGLGAAWVLGAAA